MTIQDDKKKAGLDCLQYEIAMLKNVFNLLQSLEQTPKIKRDEIYESQRNAFLESFLLHARNLTDFLQAKKFDSDIKCSDYGVGEQQIILPSGNTQFEINKHLSHLTWERTDLKLRWEISETYKPIIEALKDFFTDISDEYFPTLKGLQKNNFEDLLR